jgi:hypothetical protein
MFGGGLGDTATIVQDDKTLTITRTTPAGEAKTVVNLDGTPSTSVAVGWGGGGAAGGGAAAGRARAGAALSGLESTSTAKWDGNKLVVTTSIDLAGNNFQTVMSLMLNPAGELVVESVRPGLQGAPPTATTATYKKG